MIANAVFNAYIIFKYPEYESIQRNDAQSDIKEFLVSHPAFAKQFVDAGVDIITSNPGIRRITDIMYSYSAYFLSFL